MNQVKVLGIIVIGLALGGVVSYVSYPLLFPTPDPIEPPTEITTDSSEQIDQQVPEEDERAIGGPSESESDEVLAGGDIAPYREFSKERYEEALDDEKIIFLYFCSHQDPICDVEQPDIEDGFDKLTDTRVVGFRVDFLNDAASDTEEELAESFTIEKQRTKLILVDGEEEVRATDAWTTLRFVEAVEAVLEDQ